jgi:hypothetical protein
MTAGKRFLSEGKQGYTLYEVKERIITEEINRIVAFVGDTQYPNVPKGTEKTFSAKQFGFLCRKGILTVL